MNYIAVRCSFISRIIFTNLDESFSSEIVEVLSVGKRLVDSLLRNGELDYPRMLNLESSFSQDTMLFVYFHKYPLSVT